jgi:2-methylcitrate dehydratase PrpD
VEAETTDGRTLAARCEHSKGSPENPLTRAQIEEKFRIYARGRLPAAHIDEVIGTVARLEDLKSTRGLMDLLRVIDGT